MSQFSNIRGVFTDLDGTLTDKGPLLAETFQALWALKKKGFWLAVVSGRPAGWADSLLRLWPIDAVVFENGAGLLVQDKDKIEMLSLAADHNLQDQRQRLQEIFDQLKKVVPSIKLALDQPYRMFDFAIDFNEDLPYLSPEEVDKILDELKQVKGITFKLSSIHINYWVGSHTKVTACSHLIRTWGKKRGISKDQILYCGDSPNDEPLFEFFDHTIGVANINEFKSRMRTLPHHIVKKPNGTGFQEIVQLLLNS